MINNKLEEDAVREEGFTLFVSFDMKESVVAILAKDKELIKKHGVDKICVVNKNFPVTYERLALQHLLKKYESEKSDSFYYTETLINVIKYVDDNELLDDDLNINMKNITFKKER